MACLKGEDDFMRRQFGFLLVALFFGMQVLSLLHMAGHGFQKHQHHGQLCDIYLYSEQAKSVDTASPILLSEPSFTEVRLPSLTPVFLSKEIFKGAAPRAPPAFSFS